MVTNMEIFKKNFAFQFCFFEGWYRTFYLRTQLFRRRYDTRQLVFRPMLMLELGPLYLRIGRW